MERVTNSWATDALPPVSKPRCGVRRVTTANAFGEDVAHNDKDWAIAPRRDSQKQFAGGRYSEKGTEGDAD